jgi:hypothetical protein
MKTRRLDHRFVESFPDQLEVGVLYVSLPYASIAHACACGCGLEVITPLSPTDWKLTFDGKTMSLYPSIGRSGLPCRSHYWIKNSAIEWSYNLSQDEIRAGRLRDQKAKDMYYQPGADQRDACEADTKPAITISPKEQPTGLVGRFLGWLKEK